MPLFTDVVVRRGDFTLNAQVHVADGETLALIGPNGSGKSTLLAAIAGLLAPERGRVEVNGRELTSVGLGVEASVEANAEASAGGNAREHDAGRVGESAGRDLGARSVGRSGVSSGARSGTRTGTRDTMVAPAERRVGLLGQDPLLFPHLSARENVAFGRRARGGNVTGARSEADAWLDAVGLAEFAERRPAQLSGGQQQRVAIARALAAHPDVLLLDEPMAALDVQNATAVRTLLRERLSSSGLPTIVVSHDVIDAMVLADRVAILDEGRIVDMGDTATVLGQPKNQFAAALVGLNLVQGTLQSDGSARDARGRIWRGNLVGPTVGPSRDPRDRSSADLPKTGDAVNVTFPPSAVRMNAIDRQDMLGAQHSGGSNSVWRATVGALEPAARGIRVPFVGEELVAELTPAEILDAEIHEGMTVSAFVDSRFVTVFAARTTSR